MPNYIKNKLHVSDINIMPNLLDKDGNFDFNKIIRRPESLNISSSSNGRTALFAKYGIDLSGGLRSKEEAIQRLNSYGDDLKAESEELAEKYYLNYLNHGFATWYKWSRQNWGTKWNASTCDISGNIIEFETAWSPPLPILRKLSNLYPETTFSLSYADEDIGRNCGRITFLGGESIESYLPDKHTKNAFDLSFEMWPSSKENYHLVNGNYKYLED